MILLSLKNNICSLANLLFDTAEHYVVFLLWISGDQTSVALFFQVKTWKATLTNVVTKDEINVLVSCALDMAGYKKPRRNNRR